MAQLITQSALVADDWQTLALAEGETAEGVALPAGKVIFPLAVWQARRAEILARGEAIGLLLQPDEAVETLADDLPQIALIAVHFPRFVDGRGYSTAALLRQRLDYRGELRAVGDILHDQLFFLKRVGFDSYALKDGKDPAYALAAGFTSFATPYQASTDLAEPHFRRTAS